MRLLPVIRQAVPVRVHRRPDIFYGDGIEDGIVIGVIRARVISIELYYQGRARGDICVSNQGLLRAIGDASMFVARVKILHYEIVIKEHIESTVAALLTEHELD